jgi:GNAT superfamily N-acetyltransferase
MNEQTKDLAGDISLRTIAMPEDEDFLKDLYFSTRDDLQLLPLDDVQKKAFITMQYSAQKQQYSLQFPEADHDLILRDGVPVGRLLVDRGANGISLVDISLLADHRGTGIGTAIMHRLVEEAENAGAVFRLHVVKTNPAARLYLRMGLAVTADDGVYLEMKKAPSQPLEDRSRGE